ncbi:DUF1573 domain-containing protein [Algoriphagus sediminis]|uniref:DUF1573 domain-containing protein n=1 Tax=Algoriphagus sediminis TaxID=3057113 RepID=A0ABT7YB00_9BACT|nr:DUF1573 domain-containing protein [Algoriphagus sediminis]MDN3203621.1 DUF1573 domain-containing protein [Algoriphagus sediminis]
MTRSQLFTLFFLILSLFSIHSIAQESIANKAVWEVNRIDLGTILAEEGKKIAEFKFTHTADSILLIEEVLTDCGCATANFTRDSLSRGGEGLVQIEFDPISAVGDFERMVIVKGNLQSLEDTLYIEGHSIPYPDNPLIDYPVKKLDLGFRQGKVRVGNVYTNEPKLKTVEVFNFGAETIYADSIAISGAEHIGVIKASDSIPAQGRGLISLSYDGLKKGDLGFFEDQVFLKWNSSDSVIVDVIADVFEYFPPVEKANFRKVPQLSISRKEIDWGDIDDSEVKEEEIILTNRGQEILEIRKVQGNCTCMRLEMNDDKIAPGQSLILKVIFDPSGRFGRDQRNIYVFSNDPINPIQSLILKSRIQ